MTLKRTQSKVPLIFQNQTHPQDPCFNPSVWYVIEAWPGGQDPTFKYMDNVIPFKCRQRECLQWTDDYYEEHVQEFERQMGHIRRLLNVRCVVVFPSEFMYTMEATAPKTFTYCFDRVLEVAEEYNQHMKGLKEMTSGEGF